jgi:hypothetical protein
MIHVRWSLAGLVLLAAVMPPRVSHGSEVVEDVIFAVDPSHRGVHTKTMGRILFIRCTELLMETDAQQRLYEREAVRRVQLHAAHSDDERRIADVCWNQSESFVVKVVQSVPLIGPYLTFLNHLSGAARTTLAALALLGVAFYLAYKLYELLVVAANVRSLSIAKLRMEVRKLRHEMDSIEKELGLSSAIANHTAKPRNAERAVGLPHFEVPDLRVLDFMKHKLLRMLTEEQKQRRMEVWREKWGALAGKSKWMRKSVYGARVGINLLGLACAGLVCLGALLEIVLLPFIDPSLLVEGFGFVSIFFVLLFITLLAVSLRLYANRQTMRSTYREVFSADA